MHIEVEEWMMNAQRQWITTKEKTTNADTLDQWSAFDETGKLNLIKLDALCGTHHYTGINHYHNAQERSAKFFDPNTQSHLIIWDDYGDEYCIRWSS